MLLPTVSDLSLLVICIIINSRAMLNNDDDKTHVTVNFSSGRSRPFATFLHFDPRKHTPIIVTVNISLLDLQIQF